MEKIKLTVSTRIEAGIKQVWNTWIEPEHITRWNFASDDWQCPRVENDLRIGGKYFARMEAKDGSFGFDFEAVYNEIIDKKIITYTMSDGRKSTTEFKESDGKTEVTTTFDAENSNSLEMQEQGWLAILNNFKKYTENR